MFHVKQLSQNKVLCLVFHPEHLKYYPEAVLGR